MKKLNALIVGSIPLSFNEVQLAPAVLGAEIHNRGHKFFYHDINIEMYKLCDRNKDLFDRISEQLQNIQDNKHDRVVDAWLRGIHQHLLDKDILLVNVFSILSQGAAFKIICSVRKKFPNVTILVGGIGSHRDIMGAVNNYNCKWVDTHFPVQKSHAFGQLLLDNNYVDDWQSDVGTNVLERWFPMRPSTHKQEVVNFNYHRIEEYEWKNNERIVPFITSYGCVRRCSFCDVITSFPKYEYIQADALTQQIIETYNSTGISHLQFLDSLVNGSMSNFLTMLKNLAHAREQGWLPQEFKWSGTYICRSRTPRLDEIHKHLGASGADNLIIGVETGSDKIRYSMDKKFTNDDLLYEIEQFSKVGVKCTLLFFPAWPTETNNDFDETLKLFKAIAPWTYNKTVDSISFGTAGFILHEGTPIYDNREEIGLEPGPTNYLWKCKSNPTLTFWETMRRRMLMSKYSQMLGISLSHEAHFLRYLLYKIQNDYELIESYHGPNTVNIMPTNNQLWDEVCNNSIEFRVVNSNKDLVDITIEYNDNIYNYSVPNGVHQYTLDVVTPHWGTEFLIQVKFPDNYVPDIKQYDSGDYYSSTGVYIDYFSVDGRDITLDGFNAMFDETVNYNLPDNYNAHCNERAIIADTTLTTIKEEGRTLHEHISRAIDPHTYREIDFLTNKIKCHLENRGTGSAE